MFDIAYHHSQSEAAQAKDIARRQDIPLRYLEQIFQDLKRAGLVESKRGPKGGYFLKRSPGEITLGDVVRALQGPIREMVTNLDRDEGSPTKTPTVQLTRTLWQELAATIAAWFDGITLANLIERANELGLSQAEDIPPTMYYI